MRFINVLLTYLLTYGDAPRVADLGADEGRTDGGGLRVAYHGETQ